MSRPCRPTTHDASAGGKNVETIRRSLAATLLVCLFVAAWPAPAVAELRAVEGRLIDRVVATIAPADGRGQRILITLSDLEIEARLLMISRGALRATRQELDPEALASTLDWLIAEYLLAGEAEQLSLAAVDPADIAAALDGLREQVGEEELQRLMARLELGQGDLLRVLRRRIVVDRYLSSRLRLGAVVTEGEVREAFERRKDELGLDDFASAKEALKAQLERQRREEVVLGLVADLRSRAQVRVLHSFGGERKERDDAALGRGEEEPRR